MSEETKAPVFEQAHQNCTSEAVKGDGELGFCCPACGGQQLSYGVKTYQKAVIYGNGEMDSYGGDSVNEEQIDFACWDCNNVITDNGEPIRRVQDMVTWLKAHSSAARE